MKIPKPQLHQHCLQILEEKLSLYQQEVAAAQAAANAEGKSSVGDKYETTRAQMQGERDRQAVMLAEVQKQLETLKQISTLPSPEVQLGALVQTSLATFYLAVSLGKVHVEGQDVQVISPVSPMGQELLGHRAGDTIKFRNNNIKIKAVA